MANDYTNAILDTIQSKLSGVAVDQIKLELFNTCDELCREALRISPPTDTTAEPDTWLPTEQWAPNYQCLLDGTLARLYGQVGKPYALPEFAQAHLERYTLYLQLARSESSSAPTTIYQRVLYDLRKRVPVARDADFTAAMFVAANKIRVEALRLAPLGDADTVPANWLTGKWDVAYQAVFKGALAELYLQGDRPWAQPELGAATNLQFMQELELLRSDEAAAPATVYQRIIDTVRVQLPTAREAVIKLAMFAVANKVRVDALGVAPLGDANTDPSTWMPTGKWDSAYNAIFYGTLSHLQLQVGQPWSNEAAAVANQSLFVRELDLLGTDELVTATTVYQRIINTIRAQLPDVREAPVKLAMFGVIDKIRVDALRLAPLADANTDPTLWLPSDKWDDCYRAVLHGTLTVLQFQVGAAWYSAEAAVANNSAYQQEYELLRSDSSTTLATIYDRLLASIRVQIPTIRDSAIALEAYNAADKIRREALWLTPLTEANTNPESWFPTGKWDDCYQAMLHGTLARLFGQVDRPWSNAQLAAAEYTIYQQELDLVRGEQADATAASTLKRMMDAALVRLPGARDNIIKMELFSTLHEFFNKTSCWTETIDLDVNTIDTAYYLTPTSGTIVRLMSVIDDNNSWVNASMEEPGTITLSKLPSKAAVYTAKVALTVTEPTTKDGYPVFPSWILQKFPNDILDGLLGRMMAQLAKPYSNAELSVYHQKKFQSAIGVARTEANRGFIYGGQRWRFPQQFNRFKAYR